MTYNQQFGHCALIKVSLRVLYVVFKKLGYNVETKETQGNDVKNPKLYDGC